jgi:hypothetical protein
MSLSARKAIIGAAQLAAKAAWVGLGNDPALIARPNVPFTPPNPQVPYIDIHVLFGKAEMMTMGVAGTGFGFDESPVVVKINVYTVAGVGAGTALDICDALTDAFARQQIGAVRYGAPTGPVPVPSAEGWAQHALSFIGYAETAV